MISVIVPFYNAEEWLGRCLESLHTNKGDFEFILVDDKSKDNSKDIAYEYCNKDKRFTLLNNKYKKGVSGARNTGIVYADGDYITFLDADDEMLPDACDTFHKLIMSGDANIYQLNHMRYYTAIDKLTMKYWNEGGRYDVGNLPDCWWGIWNKLFKADFLEDIRFDESLRYGEDGMFILECFAKDKTIHHGEKELATVKHRFDNKQSLSHIKTYKDIIKQAHAYEKYMLKQSDKDIVDLVCSEIKILWDRINTLYPPSTN